MWTRLYRFRRATEAERLLGQQLWELGEENPSIERIRSIIPVVLQGLGPDPALRQELRTLLEAGKVDEARRRLREESSMRLYIGALSGLGVLASLLVVVFVFMLVRSDTTGVAITNPGLRCAEELEDALLSNRDARDFHYEVTRDDVSALMREGSVRLGYFRDGIPVEVSYTLRKEGDACALVAWQVRRDLGQRWEGARGDFGRVALRDCRCA